MPGLIFSAKVAAARAAGRVARASGRGGGTSLPGKLLVSLDGDAIGRLARRLPRGSAIVSATNGKTTTAAMVASILTGRGEELVHNRAGANMAGGIASALLDAARRGGIDGERGLFEVDEFWLGEVADQVRPEAILLSNLFRDQLDRYGELETIGERWEEVARVQSARGGRLVLCADDPLVADLGRDGDEVRPGVTYFGVQDASLALDELQHAADSKHCRRCGAPYRYAAALMGHLGHYRCPNCGLERPAPSVWADRVELQGVHGAAFDLHLDGASERVELPLPGLYNVYNALAAAALCHVLGATREEIVAGLRATAPAFGRAETIALSGRDVSIMLIKNPAGANEVLRTLALEPGRHRLFAVLNDNIADGRDISWVWDADFELLADRVAHVTCSGTRAAELALRLKYAGVGPELLDVVPDLEAGLDAALADGAGPLFALPTYTALLELRGLIASRGAARPYWEAS